MNDHYKGTEFSHLFTTSQVICQIEQTDRDGAILELLRLLAFERGIGNVNDAYEAVLEREKSFPTIVGSGIAMPHARLEAIDDLVVGVVTSQKGIIFPNKPENPINLMILTLVPKTAPGLYLQAMSSLAKICQDPETANVVSSLGSGEEIWKFFDRNGLVLPNYVLACDIMDPVRVKLHENDTLEQAIDLFVRYGRIDLPVVDKEEELIGVVSTYELLRVCLPDYILWMDDLTPILNFEPFLEVLRNESKTWLTEIMASEFATVAVDAPAIQIAKELTRHNADNAYVLRGKRLVGVVSLEGFLRKVLRD